MATYAEGAVVAFSVDPSSQLTSVLCASEAAASLLGVAQEELAFASLGDLLHPPEVLEAFLADLRRDGTVLSGCLRASRAPDDRCWLQVSAHIVPVGQQPVALATLQESSAPVRSGIVWPAAPEQITTILESITDGFIELDREGRFVCLNSEAERILGCSRGDVLGRSFWEVFPDATGTHLYDEYAKAMTTRQATHLTAYYPPSAEWFETHVYPSGDGLSVYFRNVTSRVRAEQRLREGEERFRLAVEHFPNPFVIYDADRRIQFINQAGVTLSGYPLEGIMGRRDEELFPPAMTDLYVPALERTIATGKTQAFEMTPTLPNGRTYTHVVTYVPVPNSQGSLSHILGITHDITARQDAEQALRLGQRRLRLALEAGRMGTWDWEAGTDRVTWSEGHYTLLGYRPGQVQPTHDAFRRRVHPEDLARQEEALRESMEHRKEYVCEFRVVWPDGSVHWVEARGRFLFDTDGHPTHMYGVIVDVDEKKRAEQALRESEEFSRRIHESSFDCIKTLDLRGRLMSMNSGGQRLLEIADIGPYLNTSWLDFLQGADRDAAAAALETAREGGIGCFEAFCPSTSGKPKWWSVVITPMSDTDGQPQRLLAISRDVTEQRQASNALREFAANLESQVAERTAALLRQTEQLRRLAAELTMAEQRERRRIADILHDHLQQLLVAARMRVEQAANETTNPATQEALATTRDLLTESIQASRSLTAELRPPVLYEAGLVAALEWLADRMHGQHGLTVAVENVAVDEPIDEGCLALLFECVRELLFNVVKHAGVPEARVTLSNTGDGFLHIRVEDDGAGIDLTHLDAKRQGNLGGFGLFSVGERLAAIGGRLDVESRPGDGTCIHLFAPLSPGAETPDAAGAKTDAPSVASVAAGGAASDQSPRIRVLVADDHRMVRESIARILQQEPRIELAGQAADGEEAIRMSQTLHPDVVIMDFSMPKVDGVEATRTIKQCCPDVKVIGLSMREEDTACASMCDAGASRYLTKCSAVSTLVDTVMEVARDGS